MILSTPFTYAKKSDGITALAKRTVISVQTAALDPCKGILCFGSLSIRCALGRSGIVSVKKEGDGGTPRAVMRCLGGYFRRRRNVVVKTRLPMAAITQDSAWCDAPPDANYNRPVRLPFAASHERMHRNDRLYDFCLVLDWNVRSRKRNAGSAIFLHVAKPGYEPTEGCIAVSARDMARLLPHLSKSTRVVTGGQIRRPSIR